MQSSHKSRIKIAGVVCIISTILLLTLLGYVSHRFQDAINPFALRAPNSILITLGFLFFLACASFLLIINNFFTNIFVNSPFHSNQAGFRSRFFNSLMFPAFVLLFPISLAFMIFNPFAFAKNIFKSGLKTTFSKIDIENMLERTIKLLLILLILLPLWVGVYYISSQSLYKFARYKFGYYEDLIPLAGTGSMYPTFPKGQGKTPQELAKEVVGTAGMTPYPNGIVLFGKRYYGYDIGRGDIVDFSNEKTFQITKRDIGTESGFVKRVIGLPGDTIEIRDGLVYLNEVPLVEQYIAKPRSTFGGDFISDCAKTEVPEGKLFVMGDNRKGSLDSRYELGFISYVDIDHVISYSAQKGVLDSHWRDTTQDLENSAKIKLDRQQYLKLLNEKRAEAKLPPLIYQPKLQQSAENRARAIIKSNDFSSEGKTSGYSMQKAFAEFGFSNYRRGELPLQGYYEAEELFENQFEFPESKEFLLKKDYQEIGIAEIEGQINGCPTQIIVQHLAGYVPPNYKKVDIDSWKQSLSGLKEIQPGWEKLKTLDEFYSKNRADIDRINQIISQRIAQTQAIVSRMEANQWLTNEELKYVDSDKTLGDEQDAIAKRLNDKSP